MRGGDRAVIIDDQFTGDRAPFIPPCLSIASTALASFATELQGMLQHRGEALAVRATQPGMRGSGELVNLLTLQLVNRYTPVMAHYAQRPLVHPRDFHELLLEIAGELSSFYATNRRPPDFPPYQHDDLQATFTPVIVAIRRFLLSMIRVSAMQIVLEIKKFGVRVGQLTPEARGQLRSATFVLAARGPLPPDALRRKLPTSAKLGPVEQIAQLVNVALPGIGLHPMPTNPPQLPYVAQTTYFELDKSSQFFRDLANSGGIAIHVPPEEWPKELELELWAIRRTAAGQTVGDGSMSGGNPDDPFATGAEPQRTIIRPTPGRGAIPQPPAQRTVAPGAPEAPGGGAPASRPAVPRAPAGPDPLAAPVDAGDLARGTANPLVAAAMPLLGLVVRMKTVTSGVNIVAVRDRVYEELRAFAGAGRNAGIPQDPLRAAHYALAATVDDVVMNTPWGAHGGWSKRTMVSAFHGDVEGGENFYKHLDNMLQAPAANRLTLELMYCCLSLGFEGRYRLHPRGASEHAKVRENLYNTLRGLMGPQERELSPEWRGVDMPARSSRDGLPIWVFAAAAGVFLLGLYWGMSLLLGSNQEHVRRPLRPAAADALDPDPDDRAAGTPAERPAAAAAAAAAAAGGHRREPAPAPAARARDPGQSGRGRGVRPRHPHHHPRQRARRRARHVRLGQGGRASRVRRPVAAHRRGAAALSRPGAGRRPHRQRADFARQPALPVEPGAVGRARHQRGGYHRRAPGQRLAHRHAWLRRHAADRRQQHRPGPANNRRIVVTLESPQ